MVSSRFGKVKWFLIRLVVYTAMVINLIPLFWMLLGSFKHNMDVIDPSKLLSLDFTLDNYKHLIEAGGFWFPLKNSLILTISATLASLMIGVPAAYAFSRFKLEKFSAVILIVRMIPSMTFLLPWFIMFRSIGIVKSYAGLILAFTVSSLPMVVWIMMPYFDSIPVDVIDAAKIDGASEFGTFQRVVLPLSVPGVMTTAIMTVIGVWNNFLFVMTLGGTKQRTLPMQLMNYIGESSAEWGKLLASATVISLPLILIAVFMQKYIVTGMTAGATKG